METHGLGSLADCALRVQARVVSRAAPDRCVIDAGSKTLSSDLLGLQGYGRVLEHPDWEIYGLAKSTAMCVRRQARARLKIGELVTVIPNHACVVTNLFDRDLRHATVVLRSPQRAGGAADTGHDCFVA